MHALSYIDSFDLPCFTTYSYNSINPTTGGGERRLYRRRDQRNSIYDDEDGG